MTGLNTLLILVWGSWAIIAVTAFVDWWKAPQRPEWKKRSPPPGPALFEDLDRPSPK